jgi:hypothetical protein
MTESIRNEALKEYLMMHLPAVPEEHGPLPALELVEFEKQHGSMPRTTVQAYVAGWRQGQFGLELAYSARGYYDEHDNLIELEDPLDAGQNLSYVQFEWLSHFANYTVVKKL